MTPRVGVLGALLLVAAPVALAAQAPGQGSPQRRTCRQVLPSDARRLMNARGQEVVYFLDPVRVLCTGGLLLEADSAVMNRADGSVQLVGEVVYRDSLRQLTADWANYIGGRDQLLARGNVVLENQEDGSEVHGDELDYLRETETRPLARMIVRGERPYARVPPRADSGAAVDTASSTEVWADRMEFEGQDVFRGLGNVELARGDMTGAADTATFDQATERMTLIGSAHVETDRYRLEGARIDAHLVGGEVRDVLAVRMARVESEELTVDAERIRIGFADGQLHRMEAWNPQPDSVPRALADASDFRLRADSIDARADSLGIQEVRAVGRAYGEQDPDSLAAALPASVARDWIQGDTILGFFTRRPVVDSAPPELRMVRQAPDDTAAGAVQGDSLRLEAVERTDSTEVVLERIVVIGGGQPALSLYHMQPEEPGGDLSVNFMKAERITLFFEQGNVSRVEADGPLNGLYLAPAPRPGEAGQGTATGEGAAENDESEAAGEGEENGQGGPETAAGPVGGGGAA